MRSAPRKTRPSLGLVSALRATAARLDGGARYRWTHQGTCNCGHLAQTITELPPEELHRQALEKAGDWAQHVVDYCPTSRFPIDHVIGAMLELGISRDDLAHLERLSAPQVLSRLPAPERDLDYRERADVVRYLRAWADQLEAQLQAMGAALDRVA